MFEPFSTGSIKHFQTLLQVFFCNCEKKNPQEEGKVRRKMNPKTDKIVRRTTMVGTVVASYFLLTSDYGPEPNAIDPIKKAILSAESSVKEYIFGSKKDPEGGGPMEKLSSNGAKEHQ